MKKKQWLQSLSGADDQYVLEAAPKGTARKRSAKPVRLLCILAACMAFVLLCGTLALFIPYPSSPPSVAAYASSPYYSIIQKLNEYSYRPPEYKNTLDMLWHLPGELFAKAEDVMAPGNAADGGNAMYQEITDNQVAGVIEADLIKRSDTHAYYLADGVLYVYSIEGEDSRLISSFALPDKESGNIYTTACEFFLSSDCKTVTVLVPYLQKRDSFEHCVQVLALDVSDPAAIKQISSLSVSGRYLSARLTEHGLLLMTNMSCRKFDFDDPASFIPQIETEDGTQSIAPESIVSPDSLSSASYTVMLMMNAEGTEVIDSAAFLSYARDVYVSADAVYATRSFTEYGQALGNQRPKWTVSEISCMGYGADGFTNRGSVIVDGSVLDQYSMDQYQNTLRVVTTTSRGVEQLREQSFGSPNQEAVASFSTGQINASLYVIDLDTMQVAASVENFAPEGESVRSARFDGEMAYVCTAIQQTDPVFFFDLSDLDNITVKETGTIAGFSTSLVNFGDGFLLGIGRGANGNELKVEVYVETELGVESFAKYERPYTDYHSKYKCYYIDRENGLVGLGIYTWDKVYLDTTVYRYENYRYEYMVLHFDGREVTEALRIRFGEHDELSGMRGVYVDGYYYVFNGDNLVVKPLVLE